MKLLKNTRFYVLNFSFLLSLVFYAWVKIYIPEGSLQTIRLTQIYALTAVTYIYVALLATPLTRTFTFLPFRGEYIHARRAIGVSAFYFAALHASFAFFGQLGGFPGLFFLSNKYLLAISLSFSALVILTLMAATSFDYMEKKLTHKWWKILHRFIYLASIFIIIHALMLGTHFADLSTTIPQIFFFAISFLLILEANRFDLYLQKNGIPKFSFTVLIVAAILGFSYNFITTTPAGNTSLGIHAQHIQLAKQAQQGGNSLPTNLQNFPGLQGDRTRRFTVSFNNPENVKPNQDVDLNFKVYDASSGNKVSLFNKVYEKVVHLIIVDEKLNYFSHIHPEQTEEGFEITTKLPENGKYHVYLDFQPLGAIEQQFAFTMNVGEAEDQVTKHTPDNSLTKTFGNYSVKLTHPSPLKAADMSIGGQALTFTINDASGNPVTTLKPYLASFGHLVMINQETFDYLHVHPTNLVAPKPEENGGPNVEFLPLGLYGPIKPGIYRVFGQFNPNNELFTADFTVEVE